MDNKIGKKLADLTNPTFSSISVGSVLYDIVKEGKDFGIRTLRCVLVNGSEVTVSTIDSTVTIKYHESLFNKQFFLNYNKALAAVQETKNVSINVTRTQLLDLAKKYMKSYESSAEEKKDDKVVLKEGIEDFIDFVFANKKA